MRAGGYTVHQSLTAEAAAVLKLSLGLARRRGHAQVTPLHVAYTLLGSSTAPLFATAATGTFAASAPAYGLLRRACARSHPGGTCAPAAASSPYYSQSHPAQCRALELCFNVALNRLPTVNAVAGSPSSSSASFAASILHQPSPTLSNALVAALKRAQANQRRGCVELQTQPPSPPGTPPSTSPQQQQQPMLMIKVDLDQLIISILDDPSVSRVMREAGFSSAEVKNNLEEESNAMTLGGQGHHPGTSTPSSSPPGTAPSQSLLEPYVGLPSCYGGGVSSWPPPFLNYQRPDVEIESPCKEEDVMAILEVMSRKPGRRRSNPVIVADSVSVAEAPVAGLMRRLERGDVPDELRGARVLRLHLSHVHIRLMTRADVDACVADLRRTIAQTNTKTSGLVIYVGDMRWAVHDDDDEASAKATPTGFSPTERLVAELAGLLGELRAASLGRRAWLVAAASYGTYMRCQRSSLESTWALQPVSVPASGGAGLGLGLAVGPRGATSETDGGKAAQYAQLPLLDFSSREDGAPVMCVECAMNYEIEALAMTAKAEGRSLSSSLALSFFPGWPQADEPRTSHKDDLMDLKWRWSRLCQRVHTQRGQPTRSSNPTTSMNPGLCLSFEMTSEIKHQDAKTTLSLLPSDRSDDMDAKQAVAQESDTMVSSRDMKNVLQLWPDVERSSGNLKRNADDVELPRKSKRWRGSCRLDLNLCASSEDELAASDLTNDGEPIGDVSVTDSLDSHC